MDNLIKLGGGVTPIYIPSITTQIDKMEYDEFNYESIIFQLNGKYKKLTIDSQSITGSGRYGSYIKILCDNVEKYSAKYGDGETTNISVDLIDVQQVSIDYCGGHNPDVKYTSSIKGILFK